ncbi:hypothetical protein SPWS13_3827 [Shewanella putrefaciens]|nr:hypothetical protein SPWS13_3827 [Shewanella putrefaciens]
MQIKPVTQFALDKYKKPAFWLVFIWAIQGGSNDYFANLHS